MAKSTDTNTSAPNPEVLRPKEEAPSSSTPQKAAAPVPATQLRRRTYRPSHKATFMGLAVVGGILLINVGAIMFLMHGKQSADNALVQNGVTLSSDTLNKLGVSRNPIGDTGSELTIGPKAQFNSSVKVGGDVTIGGGLTLNSIFSATGANLNKLQAGDTSLSQLTVNNDGTMSNLNLRQNLTVVGSSKLQGAVTASQIAANTISVSGNLSVGGIIAASAVQANNLTVVGQLTLGGHIQTSGVAPGYSQGGGALGSYGSATVSGNDSAGTVAVNIGTGAGAGTLASVSFHNQYGSMPHVIITPVGGPAPYVYVTRSTSGFSIITAGGLAPGGYAFDYIVMQ